MNLLTRGLLKNGPIANYLEIDMKTLNDILKEHPEWGDIPVGVYMPDGHYDYLDGAGSVYLDEQDDVEVREEGANRGPVLVFAGN